MPKDKQTLKLTRVVQRGPVMGVADSLSDLDLLAIAILRYTSKANPSHVNMATVAIVRVGTQYWYALNYVNSVTSESVQGAYDIVAKCDQEIESYLVYEEDGELDKSTHAEVKLLNQLKREQIKTAGIEIGISKPACSTCLAALKAAGITPSWTHDR